MNGKCQFQSLIRECSPAATVASAMAIAFALTFILLPVGAGPDLPRDL